MTVHCARAFIHCGDSLQVQGTLSHMRDIRTPCCRCMSVAGAWPVHCCLQGLDAEVIARMHQWRIEAPCTVYIHPAWSPLEVSLEGLALALQQLSQVIPPGCDIMVYVSESISLSATAAVLAAAAPLMPPQTTLWPDVRCELVEESQAVCDPGQGYTNMCMRQLSLNGDRYAHVAWLWQKLKFRVTPMVKQLLQLPDPRGGQYEIDVQGLIVCEKQVRDMHIHVL